MPGRLKGNVMESNFASLAAALVARFRSAGAPPDPGDVALHEFEEHHYTAAFNGFAALAEQGDAHGARMALMMSDHGPRLCGREFPVDAARHARWCATAESDALPAG